MQFYIVHEDPYESAKLLPDYALKKVNLREGWQILSDIGHLFGVTWEGQNKCYSSYHAKTRTFWISPDRLKYFIHHYMVYLKEYEVRFNKKTTYHDKFVEFLWYSFIELKSKLKPMTETEQDIFYLLNAKRKYISDSEYEKLNQLDGNK